MWTKWTAPEGLDPLIAPVVQILNEHGFKTFESCQGGEGHCYPEPTVRFFGAEFDLIRAYEICRHYGFNAHEVKRVYRKTDEYESDSEGHTTISIGEVWDEPVNEITFLIHHETGTISLPC